MNAEVEDIPCFVNQWPEPRTLLTQHHFDLATVMRGVDKMTHLYGPVRDLARNEEFSKIAVIKTKFTVLKNKTQLSVGGSAGKISR